MCALYLLSQEEGSTTGDNDQDLKTNFMDHAKPLFTCSLLENKACESSKNVGSYGKWNIQRWELNPPILRLLMKDEKWTTSKPVPTIHLQHLHTNVVLFLSLVFVSLLYLSLREWMYECKREWCTSKVRATNVKIYEHGASQQCTSVNHCDSF